MPSCAEPSGEVLTWPLAWPFGWALASPFAEEPDVLPLERERVCEETTLESTFLIEDMVRVGLGDGVCVGEAPVGNMEGWRQGYETGVC